MQVSIHSNKFLSSLERSVNSELQELQEQNQTIVDVKIGSDNNGYYAMILYEGCNIELQST